MSADEVMRKARAKYIKEKVETISFRVPIGEKSIITAHAKNMKESVNSFINRAVSEAMYRDKSDADNQ